MVNLGATSLFINHKVILGLPWLRHQNPEIDWQKGTMRLNADQSVGPELLELEVIKIMANHMECC